EAWKGPAFKGLALLQDDAELARFQEQGNAIVAWADRDPRNPIDMQPVSALIGLLTQRRRNREVGGASNQPLCSGTLPGSLGAWQPSDASIYQAADLAVRCVDRLINRLGRPPADGPAPPNLLYWNGVKHEIRPHRAWQILDQLWGRDPVLVAALISAVWGDE